MMAFGHLKGSQAAQTLFVHAALAQSALPSQAFPTAHLLHAGPPQSGAVSLPSRVPFVHVAAGPHVPPSLAVLRTQLPLAQSAGPIQLVPTRHGQPPPQSTDVSIP